jgi:hypothetical protein
MKNLAIRFLNWLKLHTFKKEENNNKVKFIFR